MTNPPVIETQALTKWYGRVLAVDGLSLQVPAGGVFGLLGPNGSGKSTTMSMLLGLVKPTSGTMRLFGRDVRDGYQQVLRRVGAIVETPAFYPYLSGRANLRYFQGISRRGSPAEVDRLLELVGLTGRAQSKFSTYSLGMKQRLGIAYALLGDPEMVLLDEPTNGMDPAGMAEVRDLVRQLGTGGRTVLLSSHLLHEVELVCDRVAILSRGRLIAQGSVRELLERRGVVRFKATDHPKAREVMSAIPWISGVAEEDGYLLAQAPPERSWELTAALAQAGVYVCEMAPLQLSLERYFLEVTGDDTPSGEETQ
ncbi:MAG: ABC transporter ATP-binding protein [Chloroflexi bacterium]|nr:ABC transporter ATP-binding protein [Chloroflexota bacterium]